MKQFQDAFLFMKRYPVIILPTALYYVLLSVWTVAALIGLFTVYGSLDWVVPYVVFTLFITLSLFLLYLLVFGGTVGMFKKGMTEPVNVQDCWEQGKRYAGVVFRLSVFTGAAWLVLYGSIVWAGVSLLSEGNFLVFLGVLLITLPASLYLSAVSMLSIVVCVEEGIGARAALKKTLLLRQIFTWKAIGMLALLSFVVGVVSVPLGLLPPLSVLWSLVVGTLSTPLVLGFLYFSYLEEKVETG